MKATTALAFALSLGASDVLAQTGSQTGSLSREDVQAVSPALQHYAESTIAQGLWQRPGLSPRDRSVVTVAAVITRNQPILLDEQLRLALDNGVKSAELSEIITHLAFYAGWGSAMTATAVAKNVFAERNIGADQLPKAEVTPLPLNEETEAARGPSNERREHHRPGLSWPRA